MGEQERDLVYSEGVKAGKRIYYFDVKRSRNGEKFISITESKKIVEGSFDNPHISFEKHKIFLYKEDFEKFATALLKAIDAAKPEEGDTPVHATPSINDTVEPVEPSETISDTIEETSEAIDGEIKIDIEF